MVTNKTEQSITVVAVYYLFYCIRHEELYSRKWKVMWLLTKRSDIGVLSKAGRCCSKASTMQFAIMVARIMYSNGVRMLRNSCGERIHRLLHMQTHAWCLVMYLSYKCKRHNTFLKLLRLSFTADFLAI